VFFFERAEVFAEANMQIIRSTPRGAPRLGEKSGSELGRKSHKGDNRTAHGSLVHVERIGDCKRRVERNEDTG